LWVFDLLLHLQTESTPDNSLAQSFPGRQKISLDDYCQFLTAMERFSKITLPSSANPICPRPYHAFVTFPERPPNWGRASRSLLAGARSARYYDVMLLLFGKKRSGKMVRRFPAG
jgi:hypothetical protein